MSNTTEIDDWGSEMNRVNSERLAQELQARKELEEKALQAHLTSIRAVWVKGILYRIVAGSSIDTSRIERYGKHETLQDSYVKMVGETPHVTEEFTVSTNELFNSITEEFVTSQTYIQPTRTTRVFGSDFEAIVSELENELMFQLYSEGYQSVQVTLDLNWTRKTRFSTTQRVNHPSFLAEYGKQVSETMLSWVNQDFYGWFDNKTLSEVAEIIKSILSLSDNVRVKFLTVPTGSLTLSKFVNKTDNALELLSL